MMTGYKGYVGIVLSIMGSLGAFKYLGVTQDEFGLFLDNLIQVVGFVLTVWGYVAAKLRMEHAGMETDAITTSIADVKK